MRHQLWSEDNTVTVKVWKQEKKDGKNIKILITENATYTKFKKILLLQEIERYWQRYWWYMDKKILFCHYLLILL